MANRFTSIVFGTVYSDRTVVVRLHKHFSYRLSTLYQHYHRSYVY